MFNSERTLTYFFITKNSKHNLIRFVFLYLYYHQKIKSMDQLSIMPPQETEFFQPTQEEIKTIIGNKKIRRIFDTQLDEEDNKAIDLFYKEVGQPENLLWTRSQVLRFLQANNFKHQQTLQTMKQYEEYRKTLPIPFDEEVQKFLNSGIIYIQGRDRRYRPLIVLNAYLINFQQMSFEVQTKGLIYLLEFIVEKMMIPGKIENWVIIIDFNGQGIMSLHINALKQMMANLQNNFRSRLYKMFLLNTTMMFKVTWNLISPFLDEITKQKINFVKGDLTGLFQTVNQKQIEQKYGGLYPNRQLYWPPSIDNSTII
ncbi:hypothetical protein pb186bvf_018441 [Paramecium bursaria]